jgi:hypothetical protein
MEEKKARVAKTLSSAHLILICRQTAAGFVAAIVLVAPGVLAQNPQLEERVAQVQQAAVTNKQALAYYTWQEQQTITIKGEVKQTFFHVKMGPDGKPLKTELDSASEPSSGGRSHGLQHWIVPKKMEEYEGYVKQIAALAQSYAYPNPARLQQLFQQGNITLGSASFPGEFQLMVQNYLKQGDSMTLLFNPKQKMFVAVQVSSYLSDSQDTATISVQFAQIPGGPNHVAAMLINGASKQLTVTVQNSDYQKM